MDNNHDPTDNSDELDMIKAVLSGDKEMYHRLVEKYQSMVYSAIARITGPSPEVEDLAQETFWQAYRSLRSFRGNSRFSTWLLRIAINKALDYLRSSRREKKRVEGFTRQVELESEGGPEKELLQKEQREYLHGFLDLLAPCYRHALERRYLDGYSYREIAREAGVALKTVESRLYRAKKQLRLLMESGETV